MTTELDGYWPSPWPAEDGGPVRRQTPDPTSGFSLAAPDYAATSREVFGANMIVLREPGEVFLQANTLGVADTTSWVERLDPVTLEPTLRSPDLPGGPFWAGGIAAHRNGYLYVTYSRWCHKLDATTLQPVASAELPRARPYNSLLILPDGHLVMKDFCGGGGVHAITDDDAGSLLTVLEPDGLTAVDSYELPEGSIARLSAAVDPSDQMVLHVVGDQSLHSIAWDPTSRRLSPVGPPRRYLLLDGQTFGWDAVIADGSAWFLDDGEGSAGFGPSFRGKGQSTSPLHLVRIDLERPGRPPALTEVCGLPGGIVANPPVIDPTRKIAVGYDSGNGVLAAWHYPDDVDRPLVPIWTRDQDHAGHLLLDSVNGLVLTYDFDHDRSQDVVTLIEITTGAIRRRIDSGSPVQTVLFPAPGWSQDFYTVSFTTVTRFHPT